MRLQIRFLESKQAIHSSMLSPQTSVLTFLTTATPLLDRAHPHQRFSSVIDALLILKTPSTVLKTLRLIKNTP
jgi:hypothetical protein